MKSITWFCNRHWVATMNFDSKILDHGLAVINVCSREYTCKLDVRHFSSALYWRDVKDQIQYLHDILIIVQQRHHIENAVRYWYSIEDAFKYRRDTTVQPWDTTVQPWDTTVQPWYDGHDA